MQCILLQQCFWADWSSLSKTSRESLIEFPCDPLSYELEPCELVCHQFNITQVNFAPWRYHWESNEICIIISTFVHCHILYLSPPFISSRQLISLSLSLFLYLSLSFYLFFLTIPLYLLFYISLPISFFKIFPYILSLFLSMFLSLSIHLTCSLEFWIDNFTKTYGHCLLTQPFAGWSRLVSDQHLGQFSNSLSLLVFSFSLSFSSSSLSYLSLTFLPVLPLLSFQARFSLFLSLHLFITNFKVVFNLRLYLGSTVSTDW